MEKLKYVYSTIIKYKGVDVGIHRDECGTELNEILDDGWWEPMEEYCYISEKHLTDEEVIEFLENKKEKQNENYSI